MRKIACILSLILLITSFPVHAQKGSKGGFKKGGGNKNEKVNIKIKNDDVKIKVKGNGNKGNVKIDIKNKGYGPDNGWHHGHYKHEKRYGNQTILWFYGPGDIYGCKGKPRKNRIKIYDGVCIRLGTNIGFMFGLLGNMRVKLDGKKGKWKPERINKLKVEIDLLDEELKLIEIKKNKIKMRLGKLKG